MSKVQALRAAPNAEAPRSHARAALAEAIERKREHTERLAIIEATLTDLRLAPLEEKVGAARATVEVAKRDAVRHLVDTKLGHGGPAPLSVKNARVALQDAEDEFEAARSARTALKEEQSEIQTRIEYVHLGSLVANVVKTDPSVDALLRTFAARCREFEDLRRVVELLRNNLSDEQKRMLSPNESGERSMSDAWRAAIAALETDPGAPLPAIDATSTANAPRVA